MPPPSEGAARLEEFTWRELFNGLSCAECGRCDRACPAFAAGQVLSPQDLIHDVKLMVLGAASAATATGSLIDAVGAEAVWACTTCMACMERCPVFNEHVPLIVQMRRHLIGQGEVGAGVQDMLMGMTRYGNSFGQSPRNRAKWTRDLEFEVKDARKEPVEYLWFVGDYASFDPRVQEVTRAVARVFHRAGLDFGILYEAEQNAGNDVRRLGEEGLFEMLRDKNLAALESSQFQAIVTTDPHTYHVLKHEYGLDGRVKHYTEVLEDLIASGRLPVSAERRRPGHVPRSLLPGPLRRGVRGPAPRAAGAGPEAGRDAPEPVVGVLLRRRGRADLDGGCRRGRRAPRGEPGAGGRRPPGSGHHGGGLPQGPGHVPRRPEDHGAGRGARGARHR